MSKKQITWVVRNQKGQIRGPFTTPEVMNYISDGVFSGDEMIAQYPHGSWNPISKKPEFYEKILETLEGHGKAVPTPIPTGLEQETVIFPAPEGAEKKPVISTQTPAHRSADVTSASIKAHAPTSGKTKSPSSEVIELSNMTSLRRERVKQKLKWPALALVVTAVAIVAFLIFDSDDSTTEKFHLLGPQKKSEPLSEKEVKEKLNLAVASIQRDTIEHYLQAQNILVSVIEGAPRILEARSLLCYTYKELWPYSYQDGEDQKTMESLVQSTKVINLMDPHGVLCEIVKLSVLGRLRESRGAIDNLLELGDRFSLYPLLFEMKAELLELDKDDLNAAPYFQKTSELWPSWAKPKSMLGRLHYRSKDFVKASESFKAALQVSPKHKYSMVGLGLLEFKGFNQIDLAFTHLSEGLNLSGRIPRALESEGYEALAEIYVFKGEKKKAKTLACRSREISPNRKEAIEICTRLGGSSTASRGKDPDDEMVFFGDQYMRAGEFLSAQAEYKAAFEVNPKNAMAALKAAKCLWNLNQSSEAIDWLNKALRADPRLTSAYVLQADYLSQRYDFSSAEQALANAARVAPNNHEVFRGMALVAFRKNDFQSAINLALRSTKIYDGDIEAQVLLANAAREQALRMRATNDKEREKREILVKEAVRYATKAVEIDATFPEAQISFAKMLAATSGVDSGINYMNELIKKYSYSSEYKVALAEIHMGEERYRQASEILEQVTSFENKNKKALLALGLCFKAMGVVDKALSTYLKAAVVDPSDAEALFQAGKIYLEAQRFDEAKQQFQRVLKINPRYPRAYYFIAKTLFHAGNLTDALEQANLEKKMYPNLADPYILSAEIFAAKLKYADCAAEYSKALKLTSPNADTYVKTARCYRLAGSLDIAEDMLALARERENGFAEIFREQGAVYQARGQDREAIKAYQTYLELSPNAPDKNEVQQILSRLGG